MTWDLRRIAKTELSQMSEESRWALAYSVWTDWASSYTNRHWCWAARGRGEMSDIWQNDSHRPSLHGAPAVDNDVGTPVKLGQVFDLVMWLKILNFVWLLFSGVCKILNKKHLQKFPCLTVNKPTLMGPPNILQDVKYLITTLPLVGTCIHGATWIDANLNDQTPALIRSLEIGCTLAWRGFDHNLFWRFFSSLATYKKRRENMSR